MEESYWPIGRARIGDRSQDKDGWIGERVEEVSTPSEIVEGKKNNFYKAPPPYLFSFFDYY